MIKIDLEAGTVAVADGDGETVVPLASREAFSIVSEAWLRCGWDNKYVYGFSWMGRPIIQLPEDMIRLQEVLYRLKPDVIIETGVAHGGSLIFYAGLCKAMEHGRIIGIDIEIRPHNRQAIESHELADFITLIEGSSTAPETVRQVKSLVAPGETAIVILDSNHSKQHVLDELEAYSGLVSVGSYIVACDGIMQLVAGGPRTEPDWSWNNPTQAAADFAARRDDFVIEPPAFPFNEGNVTEMVTYWPGAWLKRVR
ncbi:CmcI family methyltransferase [Rhodospirillaceae bacterium SYSU D60014]|uniref:cephalosporin hydroxylase family protein n=1 Tax=Virgifigura deserti TaxID=2268457 RepID=UPI000E664FEB